MNIAAIAFKLIWAVLKDMVFGKYQFAEYLRRRKFTTITIMALIAVTGAFYWMTEQALIHAGLTRQAQGELIKYRSASTTAIVKKDDEDTNIRIRLICEDSHSKYCAADAVPSKEVLYHATDPLPMTMHVK